MSLKSGKIIKKFPSEQGEQLDLVETIDEVDNTKKKRLSIVIFLFLTVGISFCFICYRQIKNVDFKKYKIPEFSLKSISLPQSKFSPAIPPDWSVFVRSVGSTAYSFSSNIGVTSNNVKINVKNDSPYAKKYLPDGVIVTENTNQIAEYLEIISSIKTPRTNFEIYTKIPGKIATDSAQLDVFSKLVEEFYWHLIGK